MRRNLILIVLTMLLAIAFPAWGADDSKDADGFSVTYGKVLSAEDWEIAPNKLRILSWEEMVVNVHIFLGKSYYGATPCKLQDVSFIFRQGERRIAVFLKTEEWSGHRPDLSVLEFSTFEVVELKKVREGEGRVETLGRVRKDIAGLADFSKVFGVAFAEGLLEIVYGCEVHITPDPPAAPPKPVLDPKMQKSI